MERHRYNYYGVRSIMLRLFLFSLSVFCCFVKPANAANALGYPQIAPDFSSIDSMGQPYKLSDYKGTMVLEWTDPECPYVKKFYEHGDMQKLQAYAHDKAIPWIVINSSNDIQPPQPEFSVLWSRNAKTGQTLLRRNTVVDTDGRIAKQYGVTKAPHIVIVRTYGNNNFIHYSGAVDNRPTDNPDDIKGAFNYLSAALDILGNDWKATNKPVPTPLKIHSSTPYGCDINKVNNVNPSK